MYFQLDIFLLYLWSKISINTATMRIWLAPMDWITDCAYRTICKELFAVYGKKDEQLMIRTEFMSASWYVHNPAWVVKHMMTHDQEPELIAQIFGGNWEHLKQCALDLEKNYWFGWIELNMGCPSPKIMKCNAWVWMLKDKNNTLEILKDISSVLQTPFSLKTRIGLSQDDRDEQFDFLVAASKYVWMIGLHGRTYKQGHSGDVDRDYINRLKEHCPDTVIIGNGWIRSYEMLYERSAQIDGSMIAQSAIGNPWVLIDHTPSIQEKFELIYNHLSLAMACEHHFKDVEAQLKETGILVMPTRQHLAELADTIQKNPTQYDSFHTPIEFRKFLFNYVSGLPNSKGLKKNIPPARTYAQLKELLESYEKEVYANPLID